MHISNPGHTFIISAGTIVSMKFCELLSQVSVLLLAKLLSEGINNSLYLLSDNACA